MKGPEVLLLPAPGTGDVASMNRYARGLFAALTGVARSRSIEMEQPVQGRYASRLFRHPQASRLDEAWSRYVAYPRSLRRRQARVFHILDQGYAHLIRSLDPERTVVTCHDIVPLLAAEGVIPVDVPASLVRTFRWRVAHLAQARRVIADSEATRTTLERYTSVRAERITVIPPGVSSMFTALTQPKAELRAALGLADVSHVLLQVATRGRYKNTPMLLKAFADVRSRIGEGVTLVRVGVPMYPDETDLASKLGVLGAVRYLGAVDDDTLLKLYNAADVLVFPSLWEGFGWPPLEAMACGTPVVASDAPAIVEAVADAGLLVPASDRPALAGALIRVLTESGLAHSLRARGFERVRRFTWTETAARTLAVYDAVLSQ